MSERSGGAPDGWTIGVAGGSWRATVTPWGAVLPRDGSPALDWAVASDERWYVPRHEPTVRQRLVLGAPVIETVMRVGAGDAVHRAYAVADDGGITIVEVENTSPRPFAVAFTRRDVLTVRSIADVPIVGLDLPAGSWIAPVGHRARVRIGLQHRSPGGGLLRDGLPQADHVARGWEQQTSRGARFDDGGASGVPVATWRAALMLDGLPPVGLDPAGFLLASRELVELGDDPRRFVDDVALAVERLGSRGRRRTGVAWVDDAAVESAWHVLDAAGERRAAMDVARVRRALPPAEPPEPVPPAGVSALAWLRRRFALDDRHGAVDLLPGPLPPGWEGRDVEAHGVRLGGGVLSVAVRWHGTRPALLWESAGIARLTCSGLDPRWSTTLGSGEALLAEQHAEDPATGPAR